MRVGAWLSAILAPSDERLEPLPEGLRGGCGFPSSSHESADGIRARIGASEAPVHCADRPGRRFASGHVRTWEGLRDQALLEAFETLSFRATPPLPGAAR